MNDLKYFFTILYISLAQLGVGQVKTFVEGPHYISPCDTVIYQISLQNLSEEEQIKLEFNYDIYYIDNSLNSIVEIRDNNLTIDLSNYAYCEYVSGEVKIIPKCIVSYKPLELNYFTNNTNEQKLVSTFPLSDLLRINFGPYDYNASTRLLHKRITITNATNRAIDEFGINLDIDNNFASIESVDIGTIEGHRLNINSNALILGDIADGVLNKSESIDITLSFSLNQCDIRPISYSIVNPCLADCDQKTEYVDDIIPESTSLIMTSEDQSFHMDFCEPQYQKIVLKNQIIQSLNPDLSSALDIGILIEKPLFLADNHFKCMNPVLNIGGQLIEPYIADGSQYRFSLQELSIDPDGPEGLSDIDNDGFYDDLRYGDSIVIAFGIQLDLNCSDRAFQLEGKLSHFFITYNDICLNEQQSKPQDIVLGENNYYRTQVLDLKKDNKGHKYFIHNETVDYKINLGLSNNYALECGTSPLDIVIYPPRILQLQNTGHYIVKNRMDTLPINLELIGDSISINLEHTETIELHALFTASCDPNVVIDDNIDYCASCFNHDLLTISSHVTVKCKEFTDCETLTYYSRLSNGPFKTVCSDREFLEEKVRVDSIKIERMSVGWIDTIKSQKLDPENYPLERLDDGSGIKRTAGNAFFFDSDTLRSRYYFTVGCSDELEELEVVIKFLQNNSNTNLEPYKSTIINTVTDQTINVISRINVNNGLVSIKILDNTILSEGTWMWELSGIVRMDAVQARSVGYFDHPMQYSSFEKSSNGCIRGIDKQQLRASFSEHWREEYFEPLLANNYSSFYSTPFGPNRTLNFGPRLQNNLRLQFSKSDIEYRESPTIKSIKYSVPKGYTLIDDEFIISAEDLELETSFNAGLYTPIATQYRRQVYKASEIISDENYTHYSFDVSQELLLVPLYSNVIGEALIHSNCPPLDDQLPLKVEGILIYKDYAKGSLDIIEYPFVAEQFLAYEDHSLKISDDFQIAYTDEPIIWDIENQKMGIIGYNFIIESSGNNLSDLDKYYVVQLTFEGISVDSITIVDPLNGQLPFDSAVYEVRNQDNQWIISDTILYFRHQPDIQIYTSNHDCGYDTLIINYESISNSMADDGCTPAIWIDTVIVYTPAGFPNVTATKTPDVIINGQATSWDYNLENLGDGILLNTDITISSNLLDYVDISYQIGDGTYLPLDNIQVENETIRISLDTIGLTHLTGLNDSLSTNQFNWRITYNGACIPHDVGNIEMSVLSYNACNQEVNSNIIKQDQIPIVQSEDYNIELAVNFEIEQECAGQIKCIVSLSNPLNIELDNADFQLRIPSGLSYIPLTSQVNGQNITDPNIVISSPDQLISWKESLPLISGDTTFLSFIFDTQCVNDCESFNLSARLISDVTNSEDQECIQRKTRAFIDNQEFKVSPEFIFREIQTMVKTENTNGTIELDIAVDVKQNNTIDYQPTVFFEIYYDENSNRAYDPDEMIIFQSDYDQSDYRFTDIEIREPITLNVEQVCNLVMRLDLGDCSCYELTHKIELDPSLGVNDNISLCGRETLNLFGPEWGTCLRIWETHPRLDLSTPAEPVYMRGDQTGIDTLFAVSTCYSCDIIDTIIISDTEIESSIELIYPETCDPNTLPSAQLILTNGIEPMDIVWDGYVDTGSMLSRVNTESISVKFSTLFGCEDSIYIDVIQNTPFDNWQIVASDIRVEPNEIINLKIDGYYPTGDIVWEPDSLFDCINCIESSIVLHQDLRVSVSIIDEQGCSYSDSIDLLVVRDLSVYIPNGFTPNNDLVNDLYYPSFSYEIADIINWSIYDRWGNRLHHRTGPSNKENLSWNGNSGNREAIEGVYFYALEINDPFQQEPIRFSGTFSLIR